MANTRGRCTNVDYCSLAAARRDIEVPLGQDFICPECSKELKQPPEQSSGSLGLALTGAAVVAGLVCIGFGAGYVVFKPSAGARPKPVMVAAGPATGTSQGDTAALQPALLLRLDGSALLASSLVPKLAAAYLEEAGDTVIATQPGTQPAEMVVSGLRAGRREGISIASHGSDAAFAALQSGSADIGMASRPIDDKEREALKTLGDHGKPASERAVALAAPAVIVNPANPVSALTVGQLSGVLDGTIKSWALLGGADRPIHLVTESAAASATSPGGENNLAASVMADENAVAVVALQQTGNAKVLGVAAPGATPVMPNAENLALQGYPLAHALYFYLPPSSPNPFVQRFAAFALSGEGQSLVQQAGLVKIGSPASAAAAAVKDTAPASAGATPALAPTDPYGRLTSNAHKLLTDLHFDGRTVRLDARSAHELERVQGLLAAAHESPDHVVLIGFSGGQTGDEVAKASAEAVFVLMTKRGLQPGQVVSMGSDDVADPGHATGRRVEVFVRN